METMIEAKLSGPDSTEPGSGVKWSDLWQPNPGPQVVALNSEAYETGYGGQAGGGKTDLLIGMAVTMHQHSQIFRREAVRLKAVEDRLREIIGVNGSYNSQSMIWRLSDGRVVELGHCKDEKDKEKWQGRPSDLKAFDELTQFSKTMFLYMMGWNRSTFPSQRCRVVTTFNPPQNEDGAWVLERYAPWIDPDSENPAKPGELRWFVNIGGSDTMVDGPQVLTIDGDTYEPLSRTFIPAALSDNPFLAGTSYQAVLDQMPEPLRSQLKRGDFGLARTDDPWGIIPGSWVDAAMKRWTEAPPVGRIDAVGLDPSRGGDRFTRCKRHGTWFSRIDEWQGEDVNNGPKGARKSVEGIPKGVPFFPDVTGIGSSVFDSLVSMVGAEWVEAVVFAASTEERDKTGFFTFKNVRSMLYWKLREALDPETGAGLALPFDKELKKELCAGRFTVMAGGVIQMEKKDDIIARIGRSPDKAECVVCASMSKSVKKGWGGVFSV